MDFCKTYDLYDFIYITHVRYLKLTRPSVSLVLMSICDIDLTLGQTMLILIVFIRKTKNMKILM